jgi:hypothetical protein
MVEIIEPNIVHFINIILIDISDNDISKFPYACAIPIIPDEYVKVLDEFFPDDH